MGFLASSHIKKFIAGKTISGLHEADRATWWLKFTDGTSVRLSLYLTPSMSGNGTPGVHNLTVSGDIIATPFDADEKVVSSLEIEDKV